ncbi:MAG: DUF47 domain-containing protein [Acidobacteriota bacterium]
MLLSRLLVKITGRKCLEGLYEHYEPVAKGVVVVQAAMSEYSKTGFSLAFQTLSAQIDTLEGQADKIKRRIRNHLPRAMFLEVDKTLFLNYTRSQDNILDEAQHALNWLGMRPMCLPCELLVSAKAATKETCHSVELLKPAIEATIDLVYGKVDDRSAVKETFHNIRLQHHKASKAWRKLIREAYDADCDFRDVYQFLKFVEHMHAMSHNAEGSADVLRAMIAR